MGAIASKSRSALSVRERTMLEIERDHPSHSAAKEEAIRERLEVTPARYYQLLVRVLDSSAALADDPLLVRRARRLHEQRRARLDAIA